MKKFLFIILFTIYIISFTIFPAFASNSTVDMSTSHATLDTNETFTITITINNSLGINSIQMPVQYDKSAFEFQKIELENSSKFSIFNSSPDDIEILSSSGEIVPLIMNLTFKVNDQAVSGDYKITIFDAQVSHIRDNEMENISKSTMINIKDSSISESTSNPEDAEIDSNDSLINSYTLWLLVFIIFVLTIIIYFIKKK